MLDRPVLTVRTPRTLFGLAPATRDASIPALVEAALAAGEGRLSPHGALLVDTGRLTGRSPLDKFVVRRPASEAEVWWGPNAPMEPAAFARLRADMAAHAARLPLHVQDLWAGADPLLGLPVRVVAERAWHALFIHHLLRRQPPGAPRAPGWTVVNLPSFRADPGRHGCRSDVVIAIDLEGREVLIGGTEYAGETKKAVFTAMNWTLPAQGALPMHAAANHGLGDPDDAAVFFGLSGTGKTTLSADPGRALLGDDEHAWSDRGLMNVEGGCYAKVLGLSEEAEPAIFAAARSFGAVVENTAWDEGSRRIDFADAARTVNTRAAYPLDAVAGASRTGLAGHPRHVVMLTCDAFGVLPPLARLSPGQAADHFLLGFTAKVAGTEAGVFEPQPTFSPCFGAPFLPRRPATYAALLRDRIARHGATCWLVNTGWTGGAHGTGPAMGRRMPLAVTRALVAAVLADRVGEARGTAFRRDPVFGLAVPLAVAGVDPGLLDPRRAWVASGAGGEAYDAQAGRLLALFAKARAA